VAESDLEISDFDYDLPPDRIAQSPARPRDASRLLVLDRRSGAVAHHRFHELPDLLAPGDLLVLNDTRVLPAAFTACRASGSRIEGCFLRVLEGGLWEVLLAGRGRIRRGEVLALIDAAGSVHAEIELVGRGDGGTWHVRPPAGIEAVALLARIGRPPLPPYIRRDGPTAALRKGTVPFSQEARKGYSPLGADAALTATDREDYQTVYARRDGAVAAPTAGLHFTPQVFERLQARGIECAMITLHVGLGTFQPVRARRLVDHRMHEEYFEISAETVERVNRARAAGRRIVAVGTTTVRALETAAGEGDLRAMRGWTRLFIRPPYEFRITGALLTNFHLPRTTLLALVAALAGRERVLAVYEEAIRAGYRFYSYGDAMLIL
jgi:S-adenosylmethionine:tRNA ribosyltransferase-isomerase